MWLLGLTLVWEVWLWPYDSLVGGGMLVELIRFA